MDDQYVTMKTGMKRETSKTMRAKSAYITFLPCYNDKKIIQ